MKYGIVVIGYDKVATVSRLLMRLNEVDYNNEEVLLIISIDKSNTEDIYQLARAYQWKHGKLIIKCQEKRLGLRNHILKCGSYMSEYDLDAMAVFEDDMYPSLAFFNYMTQAVEFYKDDDRIAGISLYSFRRNDATELPFEAEYNGYDVFFMRYASSRGQIWLRKQWQDFMDWYETRQGKLSELSGLPSYVYDWPESSWLKYHIAYCMDQSHYYVYPYEALCTCFGEIGTHLKEKINVYQIPLMNNPHKEYCFLQLDQRTVSYDAHFEREQVSQWLGLSQEELCVNLYGKKIWNNDVRYLLTMKAYPYKVLATYGLEMYPHEVNVFEKIPGSDIILYDLREKTKDLPYRNETDKLIYYFHLIKAKVWYVKYGIVTGMIKLKNIIWENMINKRR